MKRTLVIPVNNPRFLIIEKDPNILQDIVDSLEALPKHPGVCHTLSNIRWLETIAAISPDLEMVIIREEMFIFGQEDISDVLYDLELAFLPDGPWPSVCLISSNHSWDRHARNFFGCYSGKVDVVRFNELDFALGQMLTT